MAAIAAATLCGCAQTEPEQTQAPDVYSADVTAGGEYYATIEYNDEHGQWSGKVLPVEVITPDGLRTITKVFVKSGTRLDTTALKNACPDLVAKYQTSTPEKRYLKVSK